MGVVIGGLVNGPRTIALFQATRCGHLALTTADARNAVEFTEHETAMPSTCEPGTLIVASAYPDPDEGTFATPMARWFPNQTTRSSS